MARDRLSSPYAVWISDLGSGTEVGKMYYIEDVDDEPGYSSQQNDIIGTFVPGEPDSDFGLARSGKFFTACADLAVLTLASKDIIFGAHARELRMVIITLGATPTTVYKKFTQVLPGNLGTSTWGAAWTFAGQVYFGNNGDGSKGGGIYECTPNNGNWETTGGVTCSLVVLDQALNDRNDGLNCLPAMTGDNPFTQFTD